MQKITPSLWFDKQAEEAAHFYVSLFDKSNHSTGESKILSVARYDEASAKVSGQPVGSVLTVSFLLNGQEFLALNGGPHFKFSEAVSFIINCDDQEEVDFFWNNLTAGGGKESQCGWLKDKFGLSWQVVPTVLTKLLDNTDSKKSKKVMKAMLEMKKLDIKALEQASL